MPRVLVRALDADAIVSRRWAYGEGDAPTSGFLARAARGRAAQPIGR